MERGQVAGRDTALFWQTEVPGMGPDIILTPGIPTIVTARGPFVAVLSGFRCPKCHLIVVRYEEHLGL